jgi:hypothetical protein
MNLKKDKKMTKSNSDKSSKIKLIFQVYNQWNTRPSWIKKQFIHEQENQNNLNLVQWVPLRIVKEEEVIGLVL